MIDVAVIEVADEDPEIVLGILDLMRGAVQDS